MKPFREAEALFAALRESAKPEAVAAIERLITEAPDRALCRINALAFTAEHKLNEEDVIGAFLHAARLGIFDMSWNILCPACGGVLDSGATLKTVKHAEYRCVLCALAHELTLDEAVHVLVWSRNPGRIASALLENVSKRGKDGCRVLRGQHAGGRERLRPRDAPRHIVFEERAIETERDAEVECCGVGGDIEATGPECHARRPASALFNTVHPPFSTDRCTTPVRPVSAACAVCRTIAAGAS